MYTVPDNYYCPIHHIRPRFKNNVEEVLIFMADTISSAGHLKNDDFRERINESIRQFPGNATIVDKTVNNWRTEISALFGMIQSDGKYSWGGKRSVELSKSQDLVQFFKIFLYNFQYPGGHIKPYENIKLLEKGVLFKPAQYILDLLYTITQKKGKRAWITKAEACHCIFNDLRCTRDQESPESVWSRIEYNRKNNVTYDETGDVIRYAGDILDYMEIANLLVCYGSGTYYINDTETEIILKFINSKEFFNGYDSFMHCSDIKAKDIRKIEPEWFEWVNRDMSLTDFATDVTDYFAGTYTPAQISKIEELFKRLNGEELNTKDIGDCGEALVYGHECQYLKNNGRSDLIHLVKHIPTAYAMGFDIQSRELNDLIKCIEVKTTISHKPLAFFNIHLTPNEWTAAKSHKDRYYIYRLMISKTDCKLYVICNPYKQEHDGTIDMVPRDGAEIRVIKPELAGSYMELLTWEEN